MVVTVAARVADLPEGETGIGHEADHVWQPSFGFGDKVKAFGVVVLERRPFFRQFAAKEMVPSDGGLVIDQEEVGVGGIAGHKACRKDGGAVGEIRLKADADDGKQFGVEEGFECVGELADKGEAPVDAGGVSALEDVVVRLFRLQACHAAVVVARLASV